MRMPRVWMERRQSLNSERFFVIQKVWELVKLCAERRLANSLIALGTANYTRCGELPRRVAIALSTARSVGRPATSHKLALTGTTVALVLAKKTAKTRLGGLPIRLGLSGGGRRANCAQRLLRDRGHQVRLGAAGSVHNLENDLLYQGLF